MIVKVLQILLMSVSASVFAGDGGAVVAQLREKADRRIAAIRETPNLIVPKGSATYYVSARSGNDSSDGRSPDCAWRSSARLNRQKLPRGAYVLFERGGVYRGTVMACPGVTYTAYGVGEKPCICGSPKDGADPALWKRTDNPRVWAFEIGRQDVGTLVFDNGASHAIKIVVRTDKKTGRHYNKFTGRRFESYRDLDGDLHFWHDLSPEGKGLLYLYSVENPGKRFASIEFNVKCHGLRASCCPDVTIDNLSFRNIGVHGVRADGMVRNLTVRNCAFEWIGGSIHGEGIFGRDYPTRLGNGIEVWGGCDGYVVSNCCFRQVYDAGVTHQFNIPESDGLKRYDQRHIRYLDNVFEACNYSIEYFLTARNGNPSLMEDVLIRGNLMLDAGKGFCSQRPDRGESAHIKARYRNDRNRAKDFRICGNTMAFSEDLLVEVCSGLKSADGASSLPRFEGNEVWGCAGGAFGAVSDASGERKPLDSEAERLLNRYGVGNKVHVVECLKP